MPTDQLAYSTQKLYTRGAVAEWLELSLLMLKVQNTACARDFSITLSVHPTVIGYLTLFKAGESKGGEEEEKHPTSVTQLPVYVGSFHFPDGP